MRLRHLNTCVCIWAAPRESYSHLSRLQPVCLFDFSGLLPGSFSPLGQRGESRARVLYWLLFFSFFFIPPCNPRPSVARFLASGRCEAHLGQSRHALRLHLSPNMSTSRALLYNCCRAIRGRRGFSPAQANQRVKMQLQHTCAPPVEDKSPSGEGVKLSSFEARVADEGRAPLTWASESKYAM